jgi:hypothetical protein
MSVYALPQSAASTTASRLQRTFDVERAALQQERQAEVMRLHSQLTALQAEAESVRARALESVALETKRLLEDRDAAVAEALRDAEQRRQRDIAELQQRTTVTVAAHERQLLHGA